MKYVPLNSAKNEVTYPIKGTIVVSEKPFKTKYDVWSKDGIYDVVWDRPEKNLYVVE